MPDLNCATWIECGATAFIKTVVAIYIHNAEAVVAGLVGMLAGLMVRRWWIALTLGTVAGCGALAAMMHAAQGQPSAPDVAAAFVSFLSLPIIAGGMIAAMLGWLSAYAARRFVPKRVTRE